LARHYNVIAAVLPLERQPSATSKIISTAAQITSRSRRSALRAFQAAAANREVTSKLRPFAKDGLELAACGNTMWARNITLADLVPGFVAADRSGEGIAEPQSRGLALWIKTIPAALFWVRGNPPGLVC
jgi:intracellular sulfur oxidation DsrE/DsrF family protein